nr:MAG TPA: hypothetical protein [Caudoviricetes sp.]
MFRSFSCFLCCFDFTPPAAKCLYRQCIISHTSRFQKRSPASR